MANNGTAGTLLNVKDEEEGGLPGYAIAILAIGLIVIITIIMFIVIMRYRKVSEKRARAGFKDNSLQDLIRERDRLFSQPDVI